MLKYNKPKMSDKAEEKMRKDSRNWSNRDKIEKKNLIANQPLIENKDKREEKNYKKKDLLRKDKQHKLNNKSLLNKKDN